MSSCTYTGLSNPNTVFLLMTLLEVLANVIPKSDALLLGLIAPFKAPVWVKGSPEFGKANEQFLGLY